jgi:hypothetical protein
MAFIRRKGGSYYLVHNVRQRGKVRQIHLARLGDTPRITDEVVRRVSRNHPLLHLNWARLREKVNSRVELFDLRSEHTQKLVNSLRNLNLDLAELAPPLLDLAQAPQASQEIVTQLRLLRSTVEIKLSQFEQAGRSRWLVDRRFR